MPSPGDSGSALSQRFQAFLSARQRALAAPPSPSQRSTEEVTKSEISRTGACSDDEDGTDGEDVLMCIGQAEMQPERELSRPLSRSSQADTRDGPIWSGCDANDSRESDSGASSSGGMGEGTDSSQSHLGSASPFSLRQQVKARRRYLSSTQLPTARVLGSVQPRNAVEASVASWSFTTGRSGGPGSARSPSAPVSTEAEGAAAGVTSLSNSTRLPDARRDKLDQQSSSMRTLRTVPYGVAPAGTQSRAPVAESAPVRHMFPGAVKQAQRREPIPSLQHVASVVWAELGLFHFRPHATSDLANGADDSVMRDQQLLIDAIEALLHDQHAGRESSRGGTSSVSCGDAEGHPPAQSDPPLSADATRNGLWLTLYNAVFYCVNVISDPTGSGSASDCRTGGIEDDFELVTSSSDESAGNDGVDGIGQSVRCSHRQRRRQEMLSPAPLRWATASMAPQSVRRNPFARAANQPARVEAEVAATRAEPSAARTAAFVQRRQLQRAPFHGRLDTPLTLLEWYFVLRCMAEMGYARQVFFLQTPLRATPLELVVALLWLTKQFSLVAVAEFVVLSQRHPFLLRHGREGAQLRPSNELGLPAGDAQQQLLRAFPSAACWPPAGFDEKQHIADRLAQLDFYEKSLLAPQPDGGSAAPRPSTAAAYVLSLRRLITLSLHRVDVALARRAEQATQLGLHSELDAVLCLPENDTAYQQLIAALERLTGMESRVRATMRHLATLGSLVATAVRTQESETRWAPDSSSVPPLGEVLDALHNDDCTWIRHSPAACAEEPWDHSDPDVAATKSRMQLAHAIQQFEATGTRAQLRDRWRSLQRLSRVADAGGNRSVDPFLLDEKAQSAQARVVKDNIAARYSFEAALAGEWVMLQLEEAKRAWRAATTGGGPSRSSPPVMATPLDVVARLPLRLTTDTAGDGVKPQKTAVGTPPAGTSTSARRAIAQMEWAIAQLDEIAGARTNEEQHLRRALEEQLRSDGLRIVGRRRGRVPQ